MAKVALIYLWASNSGNWLKSEEILNLYGAKVETTMDCCENLMESLAIETM